MDSQATAPVFQCFSHSWATVTGPHVRLHCRLTAAMLILLRGEFASDLAVNTLLPSCDFLSYHTTQHNSVYCKQVLHENPMTSFILPYSAVRQLSLSRCSTLLSPGERSVPLRRRALHTGENNETCPSVILSSTCCPYYCHKNCLRGFFCFNSV